MFAFNPVTALDTLREGEWLIYNAADSSLGKLITKLVAHRGMPNISVVRCLQDSTAEGGEVVCYGLLDSDDILLPSAVIF